MAIKENIFKLRSTLVRYDKFNRLLPKRDNTKALFSDIDMFHTYNGHRLFIELKHTNAKYKWNEGVQRCLDEMFKVSMLKGDFCIVLWGTYSDHNKPGTEDYYSEFTPTSARLYSPDRMKIIEYEKASDKWLKRFFSYWYDYCDKNPIQELEIINGDTANF